MSKKRRGSTSLRFASKGVERKFRRQLRRRLKTLRALIEKHAPRFLDETRRDTRQDASKSFSVALRGLWVRFGGEPEGEATDVVESTDRSVTTTVRASIKQAVPDARVLPSSLDLSEEISTITGRIKSLEDYYIERVGRELEKIAKSESSQQDLRDMLREQAGLADRKAELLARDVAGSLHAEIATKRAQEAGVRGYIWRTQRDERVRPEHEEREGERFTWDSPPDDGHPGEPPLCLPSGSPLDDAHLAEVFYRRWYDGELTTIITHTGKTVRATPNHPILTDRGWVAVDELNVGDHVVELREQRRQIFSEANVDGRQSVIDETFEAFATLVGAVSVSGARRQFHGDGTNDEVDVVDLHSRLTHAVYPSVVKRFGELLLSRADGTCSDDLLVGLGSIALALSASFRAPSRLVRGACKLLALVCGHLGVPQEHRIATASRLDASFEQDSPDDRARYADLFGEGLLTGAVRVSPNDHIVVDILAIVRSVALADVRAQTPSAQVLGQRVSSDADHAADVLQRMTDFEQFGSVVEKFSGDYSGHVYNLQTEPGWYVAGGVPVKNCRCWAEPDIDSVLDDLGE